MNMNIFDTLVGNDQVESNHSLALAKWFQKQGVKQDPARTLSDVEGGKFELHRLAEMNFMMSAQRPLFWSNVLKILSGFNGKWFGVIYLARLEGILYVVDGQHRTAAAYASNGQNVPLPCIVYDCNSIKEVGELFKAFNERRAKVPLQTSKRVEADTNPNSFARRIRDTIAGTGYIWAKDGEVMPEGILPERILSSKLIHPIMNSASCRNKTIKDDDSSEIAGKSELVQSNYENTRTLGLRILTIAFQTMGQYFKQQHVQQQSIDGIARFLYVNREIVLGNFDNQHIVDFLGNTAKSPHSDDVVDRNTLVASQSLWKKWVMDYLKNDREAKLSQTLFAKKYAENFADLWNETHPNHLLVAASNQS